MVLCESDMHFILKLGSVLGNNMQTPPQKEPSSFFGPKVAQYSEINEK